MMVIRLRSFVAFALIVAVAACTPFVTERPTGASASGNPQGSGSPAQPRSVTPTQTPTPAAGRHVFVIVMENTSLNTALGGRTINSLAEQYGLATNYHAVGSPSLPNYLALTSGDTYGIEDNEYYALPRGGIGEQLNRAGLTWRAYMEGMGADCKADSDTYAVKHNPFAYYGGDCPSNVVPFTTLSNDLAGQTPRFTWITPDLCHDGHDCDLSEADGWLARMVPLITGSPAWQSNGVLFIVWDEGGGGRSDIVPLLVLTPQGRSLRSQKRYDHYSLLATMEKLLGLPPLGHAAQAEVISDLVPGLQ